MSHFSLVYILIAKLLNTSKPLIVYWEGMPLS